MRWGVTLVLLFTFSTLPAAAEEITLIPAEDTYVVQKHPDKNYHDYVELVVNNYSTYRYEIYLYFELDSLPADAVITDARLELYQYSQYSDNRPLTLGTHRITEQWSSGVTWNTRPSWSSDYSDTITTDSSGLKSWDVTEIVQAWHAGADNYGVAIIPEERFTISHRKNFRSKEYSDESQRPKLTITYTTASQSVPEFPSTIIPLIFTLVISFLLVKFHAKR
jgi:hypothetical protein